MKLVTRVLLLVACLLSGCAENQASPQIVVSPEAAARLCLIRACGVPAPAEEISAAYVHPPDDVTAGRVAGSRASGDARVAGDVVLGNAEIQIHVHASVGAPLEITEITGPPDAARVAHASSAGDARTVRSGATPRPRVAIFLATLGDRDAVVIRTDRVSMFASADGSATLVVAGHAEQARDLRTTTTFKLQKTDRAVLLSTTFENASASAVGPWDAHDEIAWGSARRLLPGSAKAGDETSSQELDAPYVGAIDGESSLALTGTEGHVDASVSREGARVHMARALTLGPREQRSFDRVLVVGARPDSSSVVAELLHASGLPVGVAHVRVARDDAAPAGTDAPFELVVGVGGEDALSISLPSSVSDVELPEGVFTVRWKGQPKGAGVPLSIHAGTTTDLDLHLAR